MGLTATHRRELRRSLMELVPTQSGLDTIIADAELNRARINLNGPIEVCWHNTLDFADRQGRRALSNLLTVALEAYPKLQEEVGDWFWDYVDGTTGQKSHPNAGGKPGPNMGQGGFTQNNGSNRQTGPQNGHHARANPGQNQDGNQAQAKDGGDLLFANSGDAGINLLFTASNAIEEKPLMLAEEFREVRLALKHGKVGRTALVTKLDQVQPTDLTRELEELKPNILHFSGHGTEHGELVLCSGRYAADSVAHMDTDSLATLLELVGSSVQLVVLNACWSERLAEILTGSVRVVIGTTREVGDADALLFSKVFYEFVGRGKPVRESFRLARANVQTNRHAKDIYRMMVAEGAPPPSTPPTGNGGGRGGPGGSMGGGQERRFDNRRDDLGPRLLTEMKRMLPSMFEEVVYRMGVPVGYLPPNTVSLSQRAVALLQWSEHQGRIEELRQKVELVLGRLV